ncbi:MAG: glycoside hydrolase family 15 protein [Phormidesmis sp.]
MTCQVHSSAIAPLLKAEYTQADLAAIWQALAANQTLKFVTTQHHLFPAAATADADNTGYRYVWVRDNVYVAYAHAVMGQHPAAVETLAGLTAYFKQFQFRFDNIINQPELKEQVMQRPHIRFDGEHLSEIDEDWEHAQNDALGYFVWLYCRLAMQDETRPSVGLSAMRSPTDGLTDSPEDGSANSTTDGQMLQRFVAYFAAIRYWEDADSGHWEEGRKVSASSIGVVVAGLKALRSLLAADTVNLDVRSALESSTDLISQLIEKGETALNEIFPWECRTPETERRYDAALLYLIYPLNVFSQSQAEVILSDIKTSLTSEYGVQRYPYDTFWCRDFQDLDKSIQTAKYTRRERWLAEHNRTVQRGEEAQWCIFDPIMSAIYGEWFQSSGDSDYLALQTLHLNRALGQITGEGHTVLAGQDSHEPVQIPAERCPELYYIQQDEHVPNVSTPLLWTQANLCIALKLMERSLA